MSAADHSRRTTPIRSPGSRCDVADPAPDPRALIDPAINSPGREGLTGTAPASLYAPSFEREQITIPPDFAPLDAQPAWRHVVSIAVQLGIPVPAFTTALTYFDGYRQERLPANLLQAQRDYFGAHTYERIDKPGTFHTDWLSKRKPPT